MSTEKVKVPAPGESLLGIQPELLQQLEPGWQRRLSFYTGRALTDTALAFEQKYRSGRLAVLSQPVTPGIGDGLDISIHQDGSVRITAGYGLTATGEDVTLPRELTLTSLDQLDVVDAVTAVSIERFADRKQNNPTGGGVFVLALLPVSGKATGAEINTGSTPNEVTGELTSSCTRDPEAYAIEDWEIVDGAQLVRVAWPNDPPRSTARSHTSLHVAETGSLDDLDAAAARSRFVVLNDCRRARLVLRRGPELLFLDRNAVAAEAAPVRRNWGTPRGGGDFTGASCAPSRRGCCRSWSRMRRSRRSRISPRT